MNKYKTPIIAGIVGFVIILIINMIIRNPLSVSFLRAIIFGLLLSGIIVGVVYVYKNFLGIDFSIRKSSINEEEKASVDIVVDDEDDDANNYKNENILKNTEDDIIKDDLAEDDLKENKEDFLKDDIAKTASDDIDLDNENIKDNEIFEKDNKDFDNEKKASDIDKNKSKTIKNELSELSSIDDDFDDFKFTDSLQNNKSSKNEEAETENASVNEEKSDIDYDNLDLKKDYSNYAKNEKDDKDKAASIKAKIGIDVSFDDVAKAIRTKLNEDGK